MEEDEVLPNGHLWCLLLLGQVSPGFLTSFPVEAPQRDREHAACRRELGAHSASSHPRRVAAIIPRLTLTILYARLPGAWPERCAHYLAERMLQGSPGRRYPMLQMRKLRLSEDRLTQGPTAGSGADLNPGFRDDALNPGQFFKILALLLLGACPDPKPHRPSLGGQRCTYSHL